MGKTQASAQVLEGQLKFEFYAQSEEVRAPPKACPPLTYVDMSCGFDKSVMGIVEAGRLIGVLHIYPPLKLKVDSSAVGESCLVISRK